VLAVERWDGFFGDEELAAVGAAAGGTGAGVGHGEEAGLVEGEAGVDLVLEVVAGITGAVADAVTALDHELWDDAMEGGPVVERLVVYLLQGLGVGPVFGAFGETDEVGDGDGCFFLEELAGEAAHGGVDDGGGAGRNDGRLDLRGRAGGVGKLLLRGWRRLRLRLRGEDAAGENECESSKRHAGFCSNRQANADKTIGATRRGQPARATETGASSS
jgi:hypothetical protein